MPLAIRHKILCHRQYQRAVLTRACENLGYGHCLICVGVLLSAFAEAEMADLPEA